MTEQAIATQEQSDLSLGEYGSRGDVTALSLRIRSMMPGGEKLSPEQAMAAAQYAILADANPFRGETYAYPGNGGKLVLVDGYKLLVRWARRQCNYGDRYDPLSDLPDGDIGYRCWILRDDTRQMLQEFTQAGATFQEAFEIAATSAVGIVRKADTWSARNKKLIPPPKGWTWDQVARKRALKNALNLAYGAPSPREIAAESWKVGDTDTIREDWAECTPDMLPEARERLAKITAWNRKRDEPGTPETLEHNRRLLHGDDDDVDLTAASKPTPKPEPVPAEKKANDNGNGRIWPLQVVQAIVDDSLAQNNYNAVGMLNLSTLDSGATMDMTMNWARVYREARATAESKEAAVIANAWLSGEVENTEEANDG